MTTHQENSLQQKISLLSEHNFVWKEIAVLTGLPKKLIKGIAKGKFIPSKEESTRLAQVLDKTIKKLKIDTNNQADHEPILNLGNYDCFKIGIKEISIYKIRDTENLVLQIHGEKLNDD
jgi:hypothetical protein